MTDTGYDEMQVTQAVDLQAGESVVRPGCHVAGASLRVLALPDQLRPKQLLAIVHLHDGAGRGLEVKFDKTCHDPSEVDGEVVQCPG